MVYPEGGSVQIHLLHTRQRAFIYTTPLLSTTPIQPVSCDNEVAKTSDGEIQRFQRCIRSWFAREEDP